jgi:hypothetical protein
MRLMMMSRGLALGSPLATPPCEVDAIDCLVIGVRGMLDLRKRAFREVLRGALAPERAID